MSLEAVGCSGDTGDGVNAISGMVIWNDPSKADTLWEDTGGTTVATVGETLARIDDRTSGGCRLEQGTAANEPTLVAWDSANTGIFIADATDALAGIAATLAAFNATSGWTCAFVVELPPALGATFHFIRVTTNAGNTKFQVYMDAATKFGLQTRRVNGDATSNIGFGSTSATAGGRYVVIASVNYSDAAGVLEVNGSTTGLGTSGTFTWATGAACEALNSGAHLMSGSSPATLASFGEHICWNRALTSGERTIVRNYLNRKWGVY